MACCTRRALNGGDSDRILLRHTRRFQLGCKPFMPSANTAQPSPIGMRDACLGDLSRLLELEGMFPGDRLSPRQFRRHLASPCARMRVAEVDGCVMGYALTLLRNGSQIARLYSIAVDPASRGLGLGRALLVDALDQAGKADRKCLRLEVRADNLVAIALYRREGFTEFGRHPKYYADGCDAIRFERWLA